MIPGKKELLGVRGNKIKLDLSLNLKGFLLISWPRKGLVDFLKFPGGGFLQGDEILEFGVQEEGADYILRPGGYAVIFNQKGAIAVIETPRGFHLPGGGQKLEETIEETVLREVFEECGLLIKVGTFLGKADELVFSQKEKTHFRKRGSFFMGELIKKYNKGKEKDHSLKWISPDRAVKELVHESHRWAVSRGMGKSYFDSSRN